MFLITLLQIIDTLYKKFLAMQKDLISDLYSFDAPST